MLTIFHLAAAAFGFALFLALCSLFAKSKAREKWYREADGPYADRYADRIRDEEKHRRGMFYTAGFLGLFTGANLFLAYIYL